MKPVIREILRMGVYQLRYMDAVPDSAAVNEAVKLAARKGFRNLKGFVNGVLRSVARNPGLPADPGEEQLVRRLSVRYSMPEFLTEKWLEELGQDTAEKMMAAFLKEAPLTARLRGNSGTAEKNRWKSWRDREFRQSRRPTQGMPFIWKGMIIWEN